MANSDLRSLLHLLDVPRAGEYRSHDLRRGHAQDIAKSGKRGWEAHLKKQGGWAAKSSSHHSYLDLMELEAAAVIAAHADAADAADLSSCESEPGLTAEQDDSR